MHPVSTVLLIVGYILAVPAIAQYPSLKSWGTGRRRLWLVSHQAGLLLVAIGWALRKNFLIAIAHAVLAIAIRLVVLAAQKRSEHSQQSQRDDSSESKD